MKKQLLRIALYSITVYLFISAFNSTFASPFHHEHSANNRRYARTLTNLNVGEPRTVRLIYFLPNDRPYRADVVQRMKEMIRGVQTFYAEQMEAHGYGKATFRVETDSKGEPIVHRVDGGHPNSHYNDVDNTIDAVHDEIRLAFDLSANVYLTVIDNGLRWIKYNDSTAAGVASGTVALIPADYVFDDYNWELAAHELGHTFRLEHDFRRDEYIMSYGSQGLNRSRLSGCHADFLSVQPYFNPDIPIEGGVPPTIELISPSEYFAGSERVSVQLALSDSEGLHQVLLFDEGPAFFGKRDYLRVWGCRGLAGEKDATVEFNYDGGRGVFLSDYNEHSITVGAVDTNGNVEYASFVLEVEDSSEQLGVPTLVKIAGLNQQGQINARLAQPFVVELRDSHGNPFPGAQVSFIVIAGDGRFGGQFSIVETTTDASGRAERTLTLGPYPESNIVLVRTPRLSDCLPVQFSALGIGVPPVSVMGGDYPTWRLPDRATRRFGKGRLGHSDRVVDFSPDGQCLAVASAIGVWFYDVATSRELALLPTTGTVNSVSFSKDGTTLASGSEDGRINLWDVATGTKISTISEPYYGINSVAFSPDGRTLASGSSIKAIDLWDVETGSNVASLEEPRDGFSHKIAVSFSPDGSTLAAGFDDGTVKLWDVGTRTRIATLPGHEHWVYCVSFSPDGRILASGAGDGMVKLWDMATKENVAGLKHRGEVGSLSFSPDESTLAVGHSGQIELWDLATEKNIATFEGQVSWYASSVSVSFSPDGRTLAASAGDTVSLRDVETGNATILYGHSNVGNSVSFSRDGTTVASGSWDGTVKLWDVETGRNIHSFAGFHYPHGADTAPSVVSFSPDGAHLAAGFYGKVTLWDVASRTNIASFDDRLPTLLHSMSFSPDGGTLVKGHLEKIVLLDVAAGASIASPLETKPVSMSLSPDGTTLAYGTRGGTVRLWDASTLTHIDTLEGGHTGEVLSVAFSPDGRTLASGSFELKLWDVVTQREIATLGQLYGYKVKSVAFSPDGRTLASGSGDGRIDLWDVQTRQGITTLDGHTGDVVSLVFSRDGTTLASGSSDHFGDGTFLLWDLSELAELRLEALAEVDIPDPNLRAVIATGLELPPSISIVRGNLANLTHLEGGNANISRLTGLEFATNLRSLNLGSNKLSDISVLVGLTKLSSLDLYYNSISDISAVANLTELGYLSFQGNSVSDLSPLVANMGLNSGDRVIVVENPLNYPSIYTHIPTLRERGVDVIFDDRTPKALVKISGAEQQAAANTGLPRPFVVEVRDENNRAFEGVPVTFAVTAGGGKLSAERTTTDENGRAQSILTLGPNSGTNTVTVSVTEIQRKQTFNAKGIGTPKKLEIVAGDGQQGLPGAALEKPLLVEVRDQSNKPVSGVEVSFSVSSGGGTLSASSVTTDSSGRAESTLTLGPNLGANTVTVSVIGIQEGQTFTAEGVQIPKTFVIVSGENQQGLPGTALEQPFVVEVRDPWDKPLPGTEVTFSVSSGGGTLSATTATTDSDGRAESILTLGPNSGMNTVTVSVAGIQEGQTFTAEGIQIPKTFVIISGSDQEASPGAALTNPFVVEVKDQSDKPVSGVEVTFSISRGGGTLSVTSTTTDSNGQAESILTLGPNPGTNTVEVTVTGVQGKQTFTTEGVQIPKTFQIISGENQQGLPGDPLVNPFVVEVLDPSDSPLPGVQVTFSVTSGGGRLNATTATTDSDGRAESTLTLGPNPGANTVTVSVTGIQEGQTFNAEGIRIPKTFVIVSGDDQQGLPGAALEKPFVVEVLAPSDNPLPGVQVTFSVTSGGGRLSTTTATTDSDGRAESILTLGPNPGTNTVTVSVTGIQEGQTFNAEGIQTPKAFWITSGFDQKGTIGEALPRPIVVYVAGQSGEPFPDVEVTFTVIGGGGTLSVTRTTTDSDGHAESTLTLGPDSGTNTVEVAVAGILQKQTATAIGELPPIPEDVNRDEVVNILDLVLVASVLGDGGTDLEADVNGDGVVNILDLVLVAGALEGTAAAPAANP